jgi:hypothetical protein
VIEGTDAFNIAYGRWHNKIYNNKIIQVFVVPGFLIVGDDHVYLEVEIVRLVFVDREA